ncbi:MAG: hypothetical protein U0P45_05640 [Acidimicrobiales bacterium]
MRTLLIDSSSPVGVDAGLDVGAASPGPVVEAALDAAGHDVVRCHAAGSPAFPCAGLTDDGCPIEAHGPIDVAITVRPEDATAPTADEAGATCAIRAGIPLVVLGGAEEPYAPWAASASSTDDIDEAIDVAIAQLAERRAAPLRAEVRRVLAAECVDAGAIDVEVERTGDTAHIAIRTELEVNEGLANVLATRVHAVDQTGSWPTTKVGVSVGRLA